MRYEYVKRFIGFICLLVILSGCTTSPPDNFQDGPLSEPDNHAKEESQKQISLGGSDYYYQTGNSIYFLGTKIKNADADTFKILNGGYSKDKSFVYYREQIIEVSDPDAFKVLHSNIGLALDKNFIYGEGKRIEGSDPNTFQLLNSHYTKDKNHVYYQGQIVKEANSDSFEIMSGKRSNLAKDKYAVYSYGERIADLGTFQVLDDYYSKDKNHVFYSYRKIEGADSATFEIISSRRRSSLAKDKYAVYGYGERIEGADPSTYAIFFEGNLTFAKDKYAVYTENGERKINEADPDTFEIIYSDDHYDFAKDKNHVFVVVATAMGGSVVNIIDGADLSTFETLTGKYSKDKNHVYRYEKIVEDADPDTFQLLDYGYSKDKNHVYKYGKIVEGEDPGTFKP